MGPRSRGKRRQRFQGNKNRDLGDITLNDFANSPVNSGNGRLKKPMRNVLRDIDCLAETAQNKFYEEVFDGLEDTGSRKERIVRSSRRKTKMDYAGGIQEEEGGVRYPIDVWFQISKYIAPESVGTFASICKDTREVVKSAGFWKSLYKRHFRKGIKLPEGLQPHDLAQRFGLRSRVIRALYHMYEPMMLRTAFGYVPQTKVYNHVVICQWYQVNVESRQFIYYFKLKDPYSFTNEQRVLGNLVDELDDITVNGEEGCSVIKITCSQYVQWPVVIGRILGDIDASGPACSRSHIQLKFNYSLASKTPATTADFAPVIGFQIMNWWHPMYPHNNPMLPVLYHSDDE